MRKFNLSKTKYCRAIQCNKMIWLDRNKPEVADKMENEQVLETGTKVGEIAREIFGRCSR